MNGSDIMARGETYEEFTAKFRKDGHKMTTDDCYTPEPIYQCVLKWVIKRYGLGEDTRIIRPFYPGGDYKNEDYSGDCVVVDNPPFSIGTEICRWYIQKNIRFFLFCQGLTVFDILGGGGGHDNRTPHVCQVITGHSIRYDNDAKINTAFVTNMEDNMIVIQGDLRDSLVIAGGGGSRNSVKPKPNYPDNVVTAPGLGKYAIRGLCIDIPDQVFLHRDKGLICGGGMVLSDSAVDRLHSAQQQSKQGQFDKIMPEYNKALELANQIQEGTAPAVPKRISLDDF